MTPKNAELKHMVLAYLNQCKELTAERIDAALKQDLFKPIFHASLSAEGVLSHLSGPSLRPSLNGARSIVLRLPALVALGQISAAEGELRRFLELVLWTVYFTDHPREWSEFQGKSNKGFSRDPRSPISYAAHREFGFYLDYARELMEGEPSGLGTRAVNEIKQTIYKLNATIHPGTLARDGAKVAPFDDLSDDRLRRFSNLQCSTLSNACLLLAAYRKVRFNNFPAGSRAHFDWLIKTTNRKQIKAGPFGLD